jgi:cation:H+ antiporter
VIALVGTRIARIADALADATGMGEALFGAIFLGASTSLPGIVTSVAAALEGHAELAFSNAIGGIAAQTVFLAIADVFHRKANLEHAAASVPNMMQGALLIILLMAVLLFMTAPPLALGFVHPGSLVLVGAYVFGVRMIGAARRASTWRAVKTPETVVDNPEDAEPISRRQLLSLWVQFSVLAAVLASAGYAVARLGIVLSARTGLSETLVGGLFTAVATSLPELVTAVAAVREGALTLAVGDIIGGNSFDVLFLAAADIAYQEGSIYHDVGQRQIFVVGLAAILTGVLLLGLLRREKRGIANIGFESFFILVLYFTGFVILAVS